MQVETKNLLTIKNYAKKWDITPSYVYKLIKDGEMKAVVIDDVQFVDIIKYSTTPKKR